MRWYPKHWRAANETAVVGTLLDQAEDEQRTSPSRGELTNLRWNAIRSRLGYAERLFDQDIRNRAASLVLGIGAAVSISGIAQTVVGQWAFSTFGAAARVWTAGPFAMVCDIPFVLWILAFVAMLLGSKTVSRWLTIATIPALIVARVYEDHIGQVVWISTTAVIALGLFAVVAAVGTPSAAPRGRLFSTMALAGSVVSTAIVGLTSVESPFARSPMFVTEYLFGGGGYFHPFGLGRYVYWYRNDALLRAFDLWFIVGVPVLLIVAAVLARLGWRAWSKAFLITFVVMGAALAINGADDWSPDLRGWMLASVIVAASAVGLYWLLRAFGLRLTITRA